MSMMTIVGLIMAGAALLDMFERGRHSFGAPTMLVGGLALAALGTT